MNKCKDCQDSIEDDYVRCWNCQDEYDEAEAISQHLDEADRAFDEFKDEGIVRPVGRRWR